MKGIFGSTTQMSDSAQVKLDEYLSSVRETEQQLQRLNP
jgi:hypothetical protein